MTKAGDARTWQCRMEVQVVLLLLIAAWFAPGGGDRS
jgi:hypothetical protein